MLPKKLPSFGKLSKILDLEIMFKLRRVTMILEKTFFLSLKDDQGIEIYNGTLACHLSQVDRKDQFGSYDSIAMASLFLDARELRGLEEEFWLKVINAKKIQEIAEEMIHSGE